ncbi:ALP1-like protein [Tanacetum coccineum]
MVPRMLVVLIVCIGNGLIVRNHGTANMGEGNNDITVLHHSPLFDDLLADNEPVAPYIINGQSFDKGFYLQMAEYPQWSTVCQIFTVHARDDKNALL